MSVESISSGFGEYDLPNLESFLQSQQIAKIKAIALSIIFGLASIGSLTHIPFTLPVALFIASLFSILSLQSILMGLGASNRAPSTKNLFSKEVTATVPQLNRLSEKTCKGFATQNGPESHQEKLNLIRQAQESIFLSGCYCGGRAFDEALELIQKQMRINPLLKTSILTSNMFITEKNRKRIDELGDEFAEKFHCLITPEPFCYLSPSDASFSLSLNHTKALIIDYGSAFLLGGSGMVSSWSEQLGEKEPILSESFGFFYDSFTMIAFRDMDFIFYSSEPNGPGTRLYLEMAKLFERFRYTIEGDQKPPLSPKWIEPPFPTNSTTDGLKVACFTSGPETKKNHFLDEMIKQVNQAQETILIDHMYFHPTPELLQALINASHRGVKITLITNKLDTNSPNSHTGYSELSRYWAKSLFEGKEKPNISFYEFDVPYTTLHKKVMLFDEKTLLIGSSNLGEKSLESVDYEINLLIESKEFAKKVTTLLQKDISLSRKDENPEIPLLLRISSTFQTLFTHFL